MATLLWIGSLLGVVIGTLHAVHLYRRHVAQTPADQAGAVYRGLWALGLWTLFGSYVLVLWIIGVVAYAVSKVIPRRRAV
jgi:site-specific recombinase